MYYFINWQIDLTLKKAWNPQFFPMLGKFTNFSATCLIVKTLLLLQLNAKKKWKFVLVWKHKNTKL